MTGNNKEEKTKMLYTGGATTWEKTVFLNNGGTIKITNKEFVFDSNNLNLNKKSIRIPLDQIDYAYPLPFPPMGAIAIKLNSEQKEYKFGCSNRKKILAILNGEQDLSKKSYDSERISSDINKTDPKKYNITAIIAFVLSFFIPILPILLGVAALNEIKQTEERGKIYAQIAIGLSGIQLLFLFITLILISVL